MEKFKTEKIVYFKMNKKSKTELKKNLSKPKINYINKFFCYKEDFPQNFLNKKLIRFKVDKNNDSHLDQKEGRWTLKEHIQFLQALNQFGLNWKKICDIHVIPSRTPIQIRSHAQKFFIKLKRCKDEELGIDFTSDNIKNINDMIAHIKSINKDYNIVTIFLYLSEKCNINQEKKTIEQSNINIKNILCKDISLNFINNDKIIYENENYENNIYKETNFNKQIINNNFNNITINNIFINNTNYINGVNDFGTFFNFNLNKTINSNFINNLLIQNNFCDNIGIFNNYSINNASAFLRDKNLIFPNQISNLDIEKSKNSSNIC